jgi:hypothetical protein
MFLSSDYDTLECKKWPPNLWQKHGQKLYYCIRTKFGLASTTYAYINEAPLFGPEQGSTLGPFLWLMCYYLNLSLQDAH